MPGFYFPELKKTDEIIQISGTEHHHIVHVRRSKNGDEIILTNGNGLLAKAEIIAIGKKSIELKILAVDAIKQSVPRIAVAFSLLKAKHDLLVVEKLTELGVKEFFPLITERSVRKASSNTVKKFERIAIGAIKQCDNAYLPVIHKPGQLEKVILKIKESGFTPVVALEAGARISTGQLLKELGEVDPCFIIGPEGGFSQAEIKFLEAENIKAVTLGNHILRAETAAIAIVSQMTGLYIMKDPDYY